MNSEDIIRMAQDCGFTERETTITGDHFVLFAQRIAAAEREACAKVCALVAREIDDTNGTATYCAKVIRARGQNDAY